MLVAALLALATSAAAAPCVNLQRFQWVGQPDKTAGYLAVTLSGYNFFNNTSWMDNGAPVHASGSYLRYVLPNWWVGSGPGPITMQDYNKCLDAGLNPANGTPLKIWDCYDGLKQQTWDYHDGMIELAGTGLCADVKDGNTEAGTTVQLWQCYPGNTNQQWKTIPQTP